MCGRDGASCRRTGRRSKKQIESKAGRETQHAAQRFTVVRHHYALIAWLLSMACLCLGNGRSHQHYKVSHLALKKKRWRRSRCTVPLGLGRFKLKAQYSLSQSIGVQTVPSKRATMGRSRRGGTQHPLGTQYREEAFNRIEMKLN